MLNPDVASIVIPAPLTSTAPVVVTSTSDALPATLTPSAPSNVNAPTLVVKLEAAPASNEMSFVASTSTSVPSMSVVVASISKVVAFKSTVWPVPFNASVPPVDVTVTPAAPARVNPPALVVKFEAAPASNEMSFVASKSMSAASPSNVVALRSTVPVVVTSTSDALPATLTPSAPSNVNAPTLVVKLEAAPASNEMSFVASTSTSVPSMSVVVASISKVVAFKSTVWPVPFNASVPPVDVTVTPAAPARVNPPALVVKFEAAPASNEISFVASKSMSVASTSRSALISTVPFNVEPDETLSVPVTVKLPVAAVPEVLRFSSPNEIDPPVSVMLPEDKDMVPFNVITPEMTASLLRTKLSDVTVPVQVRSSTP